MFIIYKETNANSINDDSAGLLHPDLFVLRRMQNICIPF